MADQNAVKHILAADWTVESDWNWFFSAAPFRTGWVESDFTFSPIAYLNHFHQLTFSSEESQVFVRLDFWSLLLQY